MVGTSRFMAFVFSRCVPAKTSSCDGETRRFCAKHSRLRHATTGGSVTITNQHHHTITRQQEGLLQPPVVLETRIFCRCQVKAAGGTPTKRVDPQERRSRGISTGRRAGG